MSQKRLLHVTNVSKTFSVLVLLETYLLIYGCLKDALHMFIDKTIVYILFFNPVLKSHVSS